MGCSDLHHAGSLVFNGASLSEARNIEIRSYAQVDLGRGHVQLSQAWDNQGQITASSGSVVRQASSNCPLVGNAETISLQPAPPAPSYITLPGGSIASVTIGQAGSNGAILPLPAGCTLVSLRVDMQLPPGTLTAANFPLGILRFEASGCPHTELKVQISYPSGSLANLALQKYGPHGQPQQTGWFAPPNLQRSGADNSIVSYTVTDNGDGDNNPALGQISDPFAPMAIAVSSSPVAIPSSSFWSLLLLSGLSALLGLRHLRRKSGLRLPTSPH